VCSLVTPFAAARLTAELGRKGVYAEDIVPPPAGHASLPVHPRYRDVARVECVADTVDQ
jgi:hypothetical protein